jgi:hypothetical protein
VYSDDPTAPSKTVQSLARLYNPRPKRTLPWWTLPILLALLLLFAITHLHHGHHGQRHPRPATLLSGDRSTLSLPPPSTTTSLPMDSPTIPTTTVPSVTTPTTPTTTTALVTPEQYAQWSRVAVCEEGGWIGSSGPAYPDSLGISAVNWQHYGGTSDVSPAAQIIVAERIQSNPPDQSYCAAW